MKVAVDIASVGTTMRTSWEDRFFLGTHKPGWLRDATVPLFVSRRTLHTLKVLPMAATPWALDSGGFTELQIFGRWTVDVETYIEEVYRYKRAIGRMLWAAPQDWMCEPQVIHGLVKRASCPLPNCDGKLDREGLCRVCRSSRTKPPRIDLTTWLAWAREAGPALAASVRDADRFGDGAEVIFHGTGLSVAEHQRRTIENFLELRRLAPDINWIPVLQGWARTEYMDHMRAYEDAGIDLRAEPRVGLGSVCRRQGTDSATMLVATMLAEGLSLHLFGYKTKGLEAIMAILPEANITADSMAWSHGARHKKLLPGHDKPGPGRPRGHKNCANCIEYALVERAEMIAKIEGARVSARGHAGIQMSIEGVL